MIRINVLTEKRKKKVRKGPAGFLALLAVVTLAAVAVSGGAFVFITSKTASLNEENAANRATIGDLSKKIEEIKRYERLNKEIAQKSALIETLRKNQSVPVRILDEVSSLAPEGLWLDTLAYKDTGITLEGFAFTNIDIVAYVENLKKSKGFSEVYLEESRESEVEKVKVYRFKMNFKVRV